MSSGYNDPQKLKDAIALAKSFKSGEFMDKKEGKKKSGFVEERRTPVENYRQTILPSDSSQNGPPPNSRWEYHDAGSFDPQIQGMKPAKSLLGGTGVAFLRGEDLAPKPASELVVQSVVSQPMPQTATSDKSSATNPIATARGHTGVNTEDSDHRQNSQPTTGSTAAQSQGPGQNIAGAASVGNIMHTFYSFAPPGLFSNSSKSNGALEPPRTAATSNLPAANLTQAPGEAPPDNLMDTITPKQTHTTPVTPRETVTTLPDTSVTNTRSNCSNSKQGLAASRFAEGGSMGSTPVQSVSGSCFSEPHPRHQAASTLIETNETTPSSVKGSPGNKAGAPHPVPNQAGGSCLIQAGYNCHAAGKLLMMTPVGEKQMRAPQLGTKTTYPQNQANYQQSPMATGLNPVAAPYSKNAPATNTRSDNPKPGNSQTRAISSNGTAKKTPKKGLAHSTWA